MAGSDFTLVASPVQPIDTPNTETMEKPTVEANNDWRTLYEAGKASLKAGTIDQAISQLTVCLELARSQCDDELSENLAPLYFEYGSALLSNYQSTSTALGDSITNDPSAKQVGAAQGGLLGELEEEDDLEAAIQQSLEQTNNGENGQSEEQGNKVSADDADDLELAFDMFEMARVIYQKFVSFLNKPSNDENNHHQIYQSIEYIQSSEWQTALKLSRVHEMLAQCEQEMEKFDQSYSDSFASLLILQALNQSIERSKDQSSNQHSNQSTNQSSNQPSQPTIKQSSLYREFAGLHMDLAVCALHQSKIEVGLHHYMQANIAIYQAINQYFQQIAARTQQLAQQSFIADSVQSSNQSGNKISLEVDTNELNAATEKVNQTIQQWSSVEAIYASIKECEELVAELNERITDLKMEVERSKQPAQPVAQLKPAVTTTGFHNQPFEIPKLTFAIPTVNQSTNQSTNQTTNQTTNQSTNQSSNQPANQLSVKRRVAPISHVQPEQPDAKRPKL